MAPPPVTVTLRSLTQLVQLAGGSSTQRPPLTSPGAPAPSPDGLLMLRAHTDRLVVASSVAPGEMESTVSLARKIGPDRYADGGGARGSTTTPPPQPAAAAMAAWIAGLSSVAPLPVAP